MAVRAIVGTLLAVVASGAVFHLGQERHSFAESVGSMGLLGGPGFLILSILLARDVARREAEGVRIRAGLVPMGMALSLLNLGGISLVTAPFAGMYALAIPVMFFLPVIAGGAGLGLGCLIPREEHP
jgi:hypothetical protein